MKRSVVGLTARLSKLRTMSIGEIVERGRYRLLTTAERRRHQSQLLSEGTLERHLRRELQGAGWPQRLLAERSHTRGRFLPGGCARERMAILFRDRFARELEQTLAEAKLIRAQRFEFFGRQFHFQGEIPWQVDPVTGRSWPQVYHADVPVHGGDIGYGDVKHVWELNRQQYLIDLAKAFHLAGSRDDLDAMRRLVRSWMRGNPYGTGVNWSCALEPAFRVWSWLWAYHLTWSDLDDDFHLEWLRGFHEHGTFLATHLEHYSSPYNHLIGEASALYTLGACFPEFAAAAEWRRQGRAVLEGRLQEQFYADGGSVEQSTFYHHATTGFYILSALVARANDEELSRDVWNGIERALGFSMALSQPDGRTPEIGGADDGKPIRMEHLAFWDFRPYQAIGAVLFSRGDFKRIAGRFYEDALWLLGPEGLAAFDALPPADPVDTSTVFAASGYLASRSDWSTRADYVCMDVGEQAAGMRTDAIPNSMHGHADCLSVIVWLGGRPVLVDSGLYAYNCGGSWEAHFRETAAHNTARIDRRDQAHHIGKMAWSHSYRATIEGRMIDARQAWVCGSHDGYNRGPNGVTHRRTVWRRPGGYVLIHDEFVGRGYHDIEVTYQFAPGALARCGEGAVVFDDFAQLGWIGSGTWQAELRAGGETPADGWICRSLGVRVAAPRLILTGSMTDSPVSLLTVIAERSLRVQQVAIGESSLIALARGGDVEWVAGAGVSDGGPIDTDAKLAVCRTAPNVDIDPEIAQGSVVRINRDALSRLHSAADVPAKR